MMWVTAVTVLVESVINLVEELKLHNRLRNFNAYLVKQLLVFVLIRCNKRTNLKIKELQRPGSTGAAVKTKQLCGKSACWMANLGYLRWLCKCAERTKNNRFFKAQLGSNKKRDCLEILFV